MQYVLWLLLAGCWPKLLGPEKRPDESVPQLSHTAREQQTAALEALNGGGVGERR